MSDERDAALADMYAYFLARGRAAREAREATADRLAAAERAAADAEHDDDEAAR